MRGPSEFFQSTAFGPHNRVFLSFRPVANGPRSLLLACLRDVDLFSVVSEGVADVESVGRKATLTLVSDAARYAVEGEVARDFQSGLPSFSADIDISGRARRKIRDALLPVLESKGVIMLTVGSETRTLPQSGLADALKRFRLVCFGAR